MKIDTLIGSAMRDQAGLGRKNRRAFGGTKTSMRKSKCIAYAWRQHRRSGNPAPFWFGLTHSSFRDPRLGRDRDGKGKAQPTNGRGRFIGFVTAADRQRAKAYFAALGYDYFTEFRDVNATYAASIGQSQRSMDRGTPTPQPLKTGVLFSNRVR